MSKLLNKPLKAFTLYALLILVFSIPVYFFVVDYIWLAELDEHNQIIKQQIERGLKKTTIDTSELEKLLVFWSSIEQGTKISPSAYPLKLKDSVYTITRQNKYESKVDVERFRGLLAHIFINGKPYEINIETNVEETDETLLAITIITILFFIFLVLGFIILNKRISRKIWQPFKSTLRKLKQFDLTKHQTIHFEKTDILEFTELNAELSRLIEKNITTYNQQKTFIENASHELQTPLALLKSKIDLLLQNRELSGEQAQIISVINSSLSRVTRTNKNLLLLAKIENQQFAHNQPIQLATVLAESLENLEDYIAPKALTVTKNIKQPHIINSNYTLVEVLVNNLLINAVQHSTYKGKIGIELDNGTLSIYNTGYEELNTQNIFKRFSQPSTVSTNSGLGLAIVKEICTQYGWQIDYKYSNGFHYFTITF